MATALELQFVTNTVSIFGGNEVLVAMILLGMFIAAAALTKIPVHVMAPVYAAAMIITASMFPAFIPIAILILGVVIAFFLMRMWRGG